MSKQLSLSSLRSAFKVGEQPTQTNNQQYTNNYYPFWSMQAGQRVVLRFLPDKDESNPLEFMVEKVVHHLTINGKERKIPCLSMYGEDCPICKISQAYYKVKDEINGKKYWKKKQNLAQAIVVEDPLPPNDETGETHQGKVRIIALGYQILNVIKEGFADPDLEGHPASFTEGCDFVIKKTEQGKHGNYTVGTKFTNKVRPLTEAELAEAEENMIELHTLLPKNPGAEKVQAMLDAEINGEEYAEEQSATRQTSATTEAEEDPEWTPPAKTTKPAVAASANDDEAPAGDVDDMLAQIRARRKKAAE